MAVFDLILKDDLYEATFVTGATYKLIDGTLEMPIPDIDDVRIKTKYSMSRDLVAASYRNRTISFSYQVIGSTQGACVTNANYISRMLARLQSGQYISGGMYSGKYGYGSNATEGFTGIDTGNGGLVLKIVFARESTIAITDELGVSEEDFREYSFRVVSGKQTINNLMSADGFGIKSTGSNFLTNVSIELECEPLGLGIPRRIASVNQGEISVPYPIGASGRRNRIAISSTAIGGTHDALTRISVSHNGNNGLLIARDVGNSIWNTPSVATLSNGTVVNKIVPYGYTGTTVNYQYSLEITQKNPVIFAAYRGASSLGNIAPTGSYEYTVVDGVVGIFVTSRNFSEYNVGDRFYFNSHQSCIDVTSEINIYTDMALTTTVAGKIFPKKLGINVQPGITGKYKVLIAVAGIGSNTSYEFKAVVDNAYVTPSDDVGWNKVPSRISGTGTTSMWMVDCGVLDFSATGQTGTLHPFSSSIITMSLYVRAFTTPVSGQRVAISYAVLVPCSDRNSYFRVGWPTALSSGVAVFSNFDAANPYAITLSSDYRQTNTAANTFLFLNETYEGEMITLVPGVENTILVLPLTGLADQDHRTKIPDPAKDAGKIEIAVRPRFVVAG